MGGGRVVTIDCFKHGDGRNRGLLRHSQFFAHSGHGVDRVVQVNGEQLTQLGDRVTKLGEQHIQIVHKVGNLGLPTMLDGYHTADVDGVLKTHEKCRDFG